MLTCVLRRLPSCEDRRPFQQQVPCDTQTWLGPLFHSMALLGPHVSAASSHNEPFTHCSPLRHMIHNCSLLLTCIGTEFLPIFSKLITICYKYFKDMCSKPTVFRLVNHTEGCLCTLVETWNIVSERKMLKITIIIIIIIEFIHRMQDNCISMCCTIKSLDSVHSPLVNLMRF